MAGGGHNGLVAAMELALAGHDVVLAEASPAFGGAARTEAVAGQCVSAAAAFVRLLDQKLLRRIHDLTGIGEGDLLWWPRVQSEFRHPQGRIKLGLEDAAATAQAFAEQSGEERAPIEAFLLELGRASEVVRDLWTDCQATTDRFAAALSSIHASLPRLYLQGSLDCLAAHYNLGDLARTYFCRSSNLTVCPPWTDYTAFSVLYLTGGNLSHSPGVALPLGGMGAISDALVACVRACKVELITCKRLVALQHEAKAISSAVFADASRISADAYVLGFNPESLDSLVGQAAFRQSVPRSERRVLFEAAAAKVVISVEIQALEREFGAPWEELPAQVLLAPEVDSFVDGYSLSTKSGSSVRPTVELCIDCGVDRSINRPLGNRTVITAYCQYFPFGWCEQLQTADRNEAVIRSVMITLRDLCPVLAATANILAVETGTDFFRKYGMARGDVDHGSFAFGNIIDNRGERLLPHGSTHISNLFNCSAGIYPGGLVSGRPGFVCADAVNNYFRSIG